MVGSPYSHPQPPVNSRMSRCDPIHPEIHSVRSRHLLLLRHMKDALQQFRTLKAKLSAEREHIQNRLSAINSVLEAGGVETAPTTVIKPAQTSTPNASDYSPRKGSLPAKILRAFQKNGTAMLVKDVVAAVKGNRVLVGQACLMLLRKGNLKPEGRGQYSLA
jgi:hypothetical protein